ncbi:MAG: class I SAM-dependent methyltransferase [Vescimonas sp.]
MLKKTREVRRMMQAWTPEGMAFLQDAMACCGYYPALARRIAPYLPKQAHVCDAGCGLGGLSVALLPYCRHVTAVDRAAAPLENLRQRAGHDPRLTVRQGISVACRRKRPTTPWCSACSATWRRR